MLPLSSTYRFLPASANLPLCLHIRKLPLARHVPVRIRWFLATVTGISAGNTIVLRRALSNQV